MAWIISTLLVAIPIVLGFYQWREQQNDKRKYDLYIKKEQLYLNMQKNLWGFYNGSNDLKKQQAFIENVQAAWLYCPDEIILTCNEFIKSRNQQNLNNQIGLEIINKLILEMRKDLLANKYLDKTNLFLEDYLNVGVLQDSTNISK